jgi:hypothetical protein
MNERGKSDSPIVPKTPANNGGGNRLDMTRPRRQRSRSREGGRPRAIRFEAPRTGHCAGNPCKRRWSECGRRA